MLEFIAETGRLAPHWSVRNLADGTLVGHIYRANLSYVFSAASITEMLDSEELNEIAYFLDNFDAT